MTQWELCSGHHRAVCHPYSTKPELYRGPTAPLIDIHDIPGLTARYSVELQDQKATSALPHQVLIFLYKTRNNEKKHPHLSEPRTDFLTMRSSGMSPICPPKACQGLLLSDPPDWPVPHTSWPYFAVCPLAILENSPNLPTHPMPVDLTNHTSSQASPYNVSSSPHFHLHRSITLPTHQSSCPSTVNLHPNLLPYSSNMQLF